MDSLIRFIAQYLIVAIVAGVVVAWFMAPKVNRWRITLSVITAGIIALVLSRIASRLYYDPRPFVTEHVQPLFYHAPDNGFPSDHSLLAMALTATIYFFNKKLAGVMLILTVLIGVARVLAKVHSPLDIGAAWVIGIVGAVAGYYLVDYYWTRRLQKSNSESNVVS